MCTKLQIHFSLFKSLVSKIAWWSLGYVWVTLYTRNPSFTMLFIGYGKLWKMPKPLSSCPRMIVTFIIFCLFISLSSAQYWCPGSSVPAPCCSRLLDGSITTDYARSDVKLLTPMYGYQDVQVKNHMGHWNRISVSVCYDRCKVGVC